MRFRQIHLDFHTCEQIAGIGKDFDAQEFVGILKAANVDSITCFSKCHHGMLYYDTKFENRHPSLTRNLLAEQIEVCHKNDIRVPIYISVGWDEFMVARHPEWLMRDCEGKPVGAGPLRAGWKKLCLNSPYVNYIVEQTEEVLDLFGKEVDGLFFDIIAQFECCCSNCMSDMLLAGYDPTSAHDRRYFASKVQDAFKERVTKAIRRKNRDCSIFYNAGHIGPGVRNSISNYTHLEVESLPSGGWGYDHFPVSARYARNLGMNFIGMTGKFHKSWADFGGFKNPAALEYECFYALAMGGACSVGDQLHPSGKITKATYKLIGDAYSQVARKEPWCRGAKPVTEIGIITPEIINAGYAEHMDSVSAGVHRMLKEKHYQYDFVDLDMNLSKYKVIILPDVIRLESEQAGILNEYVENGGKLLVTGESGMVGDGYDFILNNMPVRVKGESPYSPDYLAAEEMIAEDIPNSEHVMYERGLELEALPGARILASVWKPYFNRDYKHFCSHFHTPAEGPAGYPGMAATNNIVYIGYPIFGMYKRHGSKVYRDFVINSLRLLMSDDEKLVRSSAPTTADVLLNYHPEEDRYVLHVLHYIPERRSSGVDTIEDVIPLHDVKFSILLPDGYGNAELVPDRVILPVDSVDNRLQFMIPTVDGHAMVAISK